MKEKTSALYSTYIIDGATRRFTPAEILGECLSPEQAGRCMTGEKFEPIVDETTDPSPSACQFHEEDIQTYLSKVSEVLGTPRLCPSTYPEPFTKQAIAKSLIDTMWMKGHFRLSDLTLQARWKWDPKPLGSMAAFYSSVEAAVDYIDSLGICLSGYSFAECESGDQVSFKVQATEKAAGPEQEYDDEWSSLPDNTSFGSVHPSIGRHRVPGGKLLADKDSWIIFIPFDTCEFRLGGSLLGEVMGHNGDTFPEIGDADYFIDCFEVVREFVEDKVVMAAATVGDGGLVTALKLMCSEEVGASVDIGGIMNAYGEEDCARILFSEIPGALIQIKDLEYDYVDAELLLQDIAYYPIGHPSPGSGNVKVKSGMNNGISEILQSLLGSQTCEGED